MHTEYLYFSKELEMFFLEARIFIWKNKYIYQVFYEKLVLKYFNNNPNNLEYLEKNLDLLKILNRDDIFDFIYEKANIFYSYKIYFCY